MATPQDVLDGRARWVVEHGKAEDVLRTLPDASVDALVTDPPSGIGFMGKEWDRNRGGRGPWVAWLASILEECRRVAKPSAWALVWALPRTAHWTACAIEDAGWEVRDVVVHLTGVGWPKHAACLKPAAEHWILARAPGPIIPLEIDAARIVSVREGGDRQGEASAERVYATDPKGFHAKPGPRGGDPAGRWPANVSLEHSPGCVQVGSRTITRQVPSGERTEVLDGARTHGGQQTGGRTREIEDTIAVWECTLDCVIRRLDEQAGNLKSGVMRADTHRNKHNSASYGRLDGSLTDHDTFGDEGGPSRFFYCSRARSDEQRGEDNDHPTVKPIDLMRWLVRLLAKPGAVVLDPFAGSGSTGAACSFEQMRFVGIEEDERFAALARRRIGDGPLFDAFVR